MSKTEQRKGQRVQFQRGIAAQMISIDGTWRLPCTMEDASQGGARLTVEGSIKGLNLKEFFLMLSSTGPVYRRCELAWVNGMQIGVHFLTSGRPKSGKAKSDDRADGAGDFVR